MKQSPLGLTLLVVLALAIAVPVAGLAAVDAGQNANDSENASGPNASDAANVTAPGERMAGIVGIQEAEIDGELDQRAFGLRIAQADSNESRADVVADRLGEIESSLDNLSERRDELEQARENGSISEGQYRAEVAKIAAQSGVIEEHANDSAAAAEDVPPEHLADRGINVSAIRMLQTNASNMTGQEVSEIARSIAGPGVGQGAGPPSDVPGMGDDNPGMGDDNPGMDDDNPGMGDDNPGMGDDNPGMGDDNPGMGDDNPGMGDDNPGMGDDNPGMDDDNETESSDDDSDPVEVDGDGDEEETDNVVVEDPVDEDVEEDTADVGNETDDGGPPVESP